MSKVTTLEQAVSQIRDGMTIMIAGFMVVGTPERITDKLAESDVKDLTITCNDAGYPDRGVGKLIAHRQVRRLITSHIGLNPEAGKQMTAGELQVELVPQGTLVERIRCGGSGIGGFLTPTGVGTVVEEGEQRLEINSRSYLLELPLRADVALLMADQADETGNLIYRHSMRNFNPTMAMAADLVIAQVREVVAIGQMNPDHVMTPGIFVDQIVTP